MPGKGDGPTSVPGDEFHDVDVDADFDWDEDIPLHLLEGLDLNPDLNIDPEPSAPALPPATPTVAPPPPPPPAEAVPVRGKLSRTLRGALTPDDIRTNPYGQPFYTDGVAPPPFSPRPPVEPAQQAAETPAEAQEEGKFPLLTDELKALALLGAEVDFVFTVRDRADDAVQLSFTYAMHEIIPRDYIRTHLRPLKLEGGVEEVAGFRRPVGFATSVKSDGSVVMTNPVAVKYTPREYGVPPNLEQYMLYALMHADRFAQLECQVRGWAKSITLTRVVEDGSVRWEYSPTEHGLELDTTAQSLPALPAVAPPSTPIEEQKDGFSLLSDAVKAAAVRGAPESIHEQGATIYWGLTAPMLFGPGVKEESSGVAFYYEESLPSPYSGVHDTASLGYFVELVPLYAALKSDGSVVVAPESFEDFPPAVGRYILYALMHADRFARIDGSVMEAGSFKAISLQRKVEDGRVRWEYEPENVELEPAAAPAEAPAEEPLEFTQALKESAESPDTIELYVVELGGENFVSGSIQVGVVLKGHSDLPRHYKWTYAHTIWADLQVKRDEDGTIVLTCLDQYSNLDGDPVPHLVGEYVSHALTHSPAHQVIKGGLKGVIGGFLDFERGRDDDGRTIWTYRPTPDVAVDQDAATSQGDELLLADLVPEGGGVPGQLSMVSLEEGDAQPSQPISDQLDLPDGPNLEMEIGTQVSVIVGDEQILCTVTEDGLLRDDDGTIVDRTIVPDGVDVLEIVDARENGAKVGEIRITLDVEDEDDGRFEVKTWDEPVDGVYNGFGRKLFEL